MAFCSRSPVCTKSLYGADNKINVRETVKGLKSVKVLKFQPGPKLTHHAFTFENVTAKLRMSFVYTVHFTMRVLSCLFHHFPGEAAFYKRFIY